MRIGVYLRETDPESGGGYSYEKELSSALKSGVEHTHHEIVFISEHRTIPEKILFGLIHYFFPNPPLLRLWQSKLSNLQKTIKREHIGMVVFCTPIHDPVDTPYITVVWDLNHRLQPWFPEVSSGGEYFNREAWYIPVLQRATYIITGTETGKDEIISLYNIPEKRIRVIPMPVPSLTGPVKKESGKWSWSETGYLLYPAQFWPHKNHINLLYALKILKEKYNVPLNLVLTGSDKGNKGYVQDTVTQLGLSEYVYSFRFVPEESLVVLYQDAFALIFPTLFGPDSLPPLEAASLGCPCIVSDVPGAREQLGNAALYFDPKDPESIATAIITLYRNPDIRDALIENGLELAKERPSKKTAASIFKLVDEFENVRRCWD